MIWVDAQLSAAVRALDVRTAANPRQPAVVMRAAPATVASGRTETVHELLQTGMHDHGQVARVRAQPHGHANRLPGARTQVAGPGRLRVDAAAIQATQFRVANVRAQKPHGTVHHVPGQDAAHVRGNCAPCRSAVAVR